MTYAKAWQWRCNHRNADVCDITARTVRKLVWREKKCWRCDEKQNHPKNVTLFGGVLYMHFWTPTAIITSFVINPDGNEVPKETTMSVNMWQQDEKHNDHKTWWKHWPISGPFGCVRMFLSLVFNVHVMLILTIRIGMQIIDITTFMIVAISNFWTYLSILTTFLCFVNFIFNTTNDNNNENHCHDSWQYSNNNTHTTSILHDFFSGTDSSPAEWHGSVPRLNPTSTAGAGGAAGFVSCRGESDGLSMVQRCATGIKSETLRVPSGNVKHQPGKSPKWKSRKSSVSTFLFKQSHG